MSNETENTDKFNLQRFIDAQDCDDSYKHAFEEVFNGRKTTHWIWYVFPQLEGLGTSSMCRRYAISSLDEARAFLANPTLHDRLLKITIAALSNLSSCRGPLTAVEIFGSVDAAKLRSCMTLFMLASEIGSAENKLFFSVLNTAFDGVPCKITMEKILMGEGAKITSGVGPISASAIL